MHCLYRDQLQHSHMFEVLVTCDKHASYTKKHGCRRRGRLLAISCSFKFPFIFHYTHMLVLFRTDAIEINWKKGSCRVFWAKKIVMLSTTPVRLWSCARQRLVETDHISFLPSKQSRLKRTKRNDRNWRSCRNIQKKKRETKETTKTKETEDKMSRKCRFHSKFGLWYKWLIFPFRNYWVTWWSCGNA